MKIPPHNWEQETPPEFIVAESDDLTYVLRRAEIIGYGAEKGKIRSHKHWSYHKYATFARAADAFEFVRVMEYREGE
jgi:hypothetical protein